MKKSFTAPSYIFEIIAALFVSTLILSNIVSIKPVQIGPAVFDAGTILFPLAYIIGDVVTEVYGFKRTKRLLVISCFILVMMSVLFWIVSAMPAPVSWSGQESFDSTLGVVWRISFASIVAIFIGELLNAYVLSYMKLKLKGKQLWGRLVGSTVIGAGFDTVIFSVLAFWGTMPTAVLLQLIVTVYLIKIATEVLVSPLTMLAIRWIKKREGVDVYERPSLI